jgi:hypothetical protein
MDILKGNDKQGAMVFSTASMEEESAQTSKDESNTEEDSKDKSWQEDGSEVAQLTAKMRKATALLQLNSDKEGSDFQESDMSIRSYNLDLDLSDYESEAQEVSSGEFDANYYKKYANPKTFLDAVWNAAGPSVGAMGICFEIIHEELTGQIAGVPAEFRELQNS